MSVQLPPLDVTEPLEQHSRAILSWDSADLTLEARTKQAVSWTRDATRTVVDSLGNNVVMVPKQTAWHIVGGVPTLYLGDEDLHGWTYERKPIAKSGFLEIYHLAGIDANGGVFYIGKDAGDGAFLLLDWSGTAYRITHDNDVDSPVSVAAGATPSAGDRVRLRFELLTEGSVKLHQTINAGAEVSTALSDVPAAGLAAAWGADAGVTHARLGGKGSGDEGEAAYKRIVLLPGSGRTLAQLEGVY